jgi:hypothetical protein
MRRLLLPVLLCALPLAACAPELPPEQLAARRAEQLLARAGHAGTTLLAPIAGLDNQGQPGVCGLIETRAGPVRAVVELATGAVRTGQPAAAGVSRQDLGESRYCDNSARARWDRAKQADPVGLVARLGA